MEIFGRNFSGYSIKHPEFSAIVSLVNPAFLPLNKLESAFSGQFTFDEPSMDTP